MAKKVVGLEELLVEELQDLLDVEKQLVRAIPKMAKAASDEELGNALKEHLEVTKGHVQRLEQVFESMDRRAKSRPCKGMKGIIEEGSEMLAEGLEDAVLDTAITGAARKVEHYEMMGYESACSLALQLGMQDAAELLKQTLQEEVQADKDLAQLSKRLLKEASSRNEMEEDEAGRKSGGRRSAGRATQSSGHTSHPLTDHDAIRQWAEDRGANPACVKGTGDSGDIGMLRLDFPGYSGEETLQEISWDAWFEKFDENELALLVQDKTAGGEKSNFNKLVDRKTVEQPRTRTA